MKRLLAPGALLLIACGTTPTASPSSGGVEGARARAERGPATTPAPEALVRQVLERAAAREGRAAAAAWRCWTRRECAPAAAEEGARDREVAIELLGYRSARAGLADRAAARMALAETVASIERAATEGRADQLVWEGVAPFVRADVPALLLETAPERRRKVLALATELVRADALRAAEGARARDEVAARVGQRGADLLAARAGVRKGELRRVAEGVLEGTRGLVAPLANGTADLPALNAWHAADLDPQAKTRGPWLGEVDGSPPRGSAPGVPSCFLVDPPEDVRFVPAASARAVAESRAAASCAAAGRRLPRIAWDPMWVLSVAQLFEQTAWLSSARARDPAARARHAQAYVYRVRGFAARVLLLLDGGDAAARDAIATRWTAPGEPALAGAGVLLPVDEAGAASDALLAALVAAAVDARLAERFGPGWAGRGEAKVGAELARLGARWHEVGPVALLAELGFAEVSAAPVVARARALTKERASPGS